ncbi:MAG TPA: T9SS type A sorting domain-containing protein, partial [Chitinophagales bacterium]|nr:T9SS type A sorting domain-containing protein [Chitinophagales bacterium]
TYIWSNGATIANPTVSPPSTTSYSLTVTDAMGDANVDVITVTVSTPILSPTINQVTCFGANDGSVCLNLVGGTVPFTYNWSPAITSTPCATNLAAGVYGVTVTDAAGCSVTAAFTIVEPTAIQLSDTVSNATCFGSSNGSIDVTVIGGTPVYSYTWSTFITTEDASNLPAGTYVITVTDANGCTASDAYTVTEPTALQLSVTTINASCIYSADGAIDLTVTDGTAPYNYLWSDVSILEDLAGIPTGAFTVTVTDANLCTASISAQVNSVNSLALDSVVSTPATCFGGADGTACVYVSGGVGSYAYTWNTNPPQSSSCSNTLVAGSYTVTITDGGGCYAIATPTITQPSQLVVNVYTADGVNTPDSLIYANVTGGIPDYSYVWSNAITDSAFAMISCTDGEVWVTVTDANGCTAIDTVNFVANMDCVWPGDADDNGIADNNDLLPIGLAYGSTGPFRPDNNISWHAKDCENWIDTLAAGSNYKHIDCDGNGVINANDTFAIIQNYGLTHSKNEEQREWRSGLPALLVDLMPDTTRAGDTMYANLYLGDTSINATNVYGLAFTLNYDVNVVDTALTQMQFGNSWLGTATDKIHIAKDLKQGQIKCAVTRIDHTNRSGSGQIAQAKFVITTDNINGKDLAYYGMRVWVTDLVVIDNDGLELEVNEGQDSTEVEFEPLSVSNMPLADGSLKIQPNPANNMVQVNVTREVVGGSIKLMDMQGRNLFETPVTSTVLKLETTTLANGIYLVQLSNGHGKLTKRLIVTH